MSTVKAFGAARVPGIKFGKKAGISLKGGSHPAPGGQTPPVLQQLKPDAPFLANFRGFWIGAREIDEINGFGAMAEWTKVKPLPSQPKRPESQ